MTAYTSSVAVVRTVARDADAARPLPHVVRAWYNRLLIRRASRKREGYRRLLMCLRCIYRLGCTLECGKCDRQTCFRLYVNGRQQTASLNLHGRNNEAPRLTLAIADDKITIACFLK